MENVAIEIIEKAKVYYLNQLIDRLIFRLKRVDQSLRLNPDCALNNFWEEICVQHQSDKWFAYGLVEDYLEAEISSLVENLPDHILLILSFSDEREENSGIFIEYINECVLNQLYAKAANFSNNRIEKFLYL